MNFIALEIPDNDTDRALWLEQQLVGLELRDLIVQLMAGRPLRHDLTLDEALGDRIGTILETGLRSLTHHELQGLLDAPELLIELQERVFIEGGKYWRSVPRTAEHKANSERIRNSVLSTVTSVTPTKLAHRQPMRTANRWGWPLAVAAAVIIAAGWWSLQPSSSGRGFERPGLLAETRPAPAYLRVLANAVGDFKPQPSATSAELRRSLAEFSQSCDTLIATEHQQLQAADRDWLVERCRIWQTKIDAMIVSLDDGADIDAIRLQTTTLIERLQGVLRERAKQIS